MSQASIPLQMIRVATPCTDSWLAMAGDDQVRFCGKCSQHVYNLSEMTEAAAQALVQSHEGDMCVRFYRRADGTMMTKDCPVGVAKKPMNTSFAILGLAVVFVFLTLGIFSFASPQERDNGRRFTLERALQWLFPAKANECVMGKR